MRHVGIIVSIVIILSQSIVLNAQIEKVNTIKKTTIESIQLSNILTSEAKETEENSDINSEQDTELIKTNITASEPNYKILSELIEKNSLSEHSDFSNEIVVVPYKYIKAHSWEYIMEKLGFYSECNEVEAMFLSVFTIKDSTLFSMYKTFYNTLDSNNYNCQSWNHFHLNDIFMGVDDFQDVFDAFEAIGELSNNNFDSTDIYKIDNSDKFYMGVTYIGKEKSKVGKLALVDINLFYNKEKIIRIFEDELNTAIFLSLRDYMQAVWAIFDIIHKNTTTLESLELE